MDPTDLTWASRDPGHLPFAWPRRSARTAVVPGVWRGRGHCHRPLYSPSHPHGPEGLQVCPRPDVAGSQLRLSGPGLATCRPLLHRELLWESGEWGAHPHSSRRSRHQVKWSTLLGSCTEWAQKTRAPACPCGRSRGGYVRDDSWRPHTATCSGHPLQPGRREDREDRGQESRWGSTSDFVRLSLGTRLSRQRLSRGVTAQGGRLLPLTTGWC